MDIPDELRDRLLSLLGDPILPIALIVVIALVSIRFARGVVHGVVGTVLDREAAEGTSQDVSAVELEKRKDTLENLATNVIRAFVILIAGVMILGELELDIGPAIAGLGIVGIAIGFGAQSLVRDYFNGALILVENQFSKGDVVRIADVSGVVEDFSLRRTTLRDLSGVLHTVPNGEIRVASNSTRAWARVNENVEVAYGTDIERTIDIVDEVGRRLAEDPDWQRRILEPPAVLRVEALGESGVTLKVLGTVRASEQWAVAGELRRRILDAFLANDVEIPFPHRVVISRSEPEAAEETSDAGAPRPGGTGRAPAAQDARAVRGDDAAQEA